MGAMVTSMPAARPRSRNVSAEPARPLPKRKSAPTTAWQRPRSRARTPWTKSSGEREARGASKGSSKRVSTPSISSRCALACAFISRKGGASGANHSRGCGSKVSTPRGAPSRRARSMTAWWPRWTPSKFPMAAEALRASGGIEERSRRMRMVGSLVLAPERRNPRLRGGPVPGSCRSLAPNILGRVREGRRPSRGVSAGSRWRRWAQAAAPR
jgi:hypothetical protein